MQKLILSASLALAMVATQVSAQETKEECYLTRRLLSIMYTGDNSYVYVSRAVFKNGVISDFVVGVGGGFFGFGGRNVVVTASLAQIKGCKLSTAMTLTELEALPTKP